MVRYWSAIYSDGARNQADGRHYLIVPTCNETEKL